MGQPVFQQPVKAVEFLRFSASYKFSESKPVAARESAALDSHAKRLQVCSLSWTSILRPSQWVLNRDRASVPPQEGAAAESMTGPPAKC